MWAFISRILMNCEIVILLDCFGIINICKEYKNYLLSCLDI